MIDLDFMCVIEDCDRVPVLHLVVGFGPTNRVNGQYRGTSCCSWEHLREYAAMREERA